MKNIKAYGIVGLLHFLVKWLIRLGMFVVVPQRQRHPSAALAWLLFIALFPIPGLILYLLIGSPKLSRTRRMQQRSMEETLRVIVEEFRTRPEFKDMFVPDVDPRYAALVQLNQHMGVLPLLGGNHIELLPDYDGAIDRLIADIDGAQRYVHAEYFMFADDETGSRVVDALIRAHQRDVKVRVLVDHLGNIAFIKPLFARLCEAGVAAREMLPVRVFDNEWSRLDLRNHRKIVVIDGQIGFTGSQNLINSNYNKPGNIKKGLYYEELVTRVTGPVVLELQAVFGSDWRAETGEMLYRGTHPELAVVPVVTGNALAQVLPSGPGQDLENNWLLFNALFHHAREKIVITTPYFVPDEVLRTAITTAARRGVEVHLFVSGIADQFLVSRAQRANYAELIEAGVKIHLFNAPVLLHAKNMSIDDDIAIIGSSNMDMRSFQLNLEVSLVVYDREVVALLREVEASYFARSTELTLEAWQQQPFVSKVVQNTARLMSEFV